MWQGTEEISLDKEKAKRVMIYYAAPMPYKYGFFTSTNKAVRDAYLQERNRFCEE